MVLQIEASKTQKNAQKLTFIETKGCLKVTINCIFFLSVLLVTVQKNVGKEEFFSEFLHF